ncbi:DUF4386 domain-containing protein [Streptomyces sp. NPDC050617]|uniref:DUF4386 domain-containing protein n=1 Tax=Streptomyces sp. NPDC050617 TaxID=3154628 RepID=UPI00342D22C3
MEALEPTSRDMRRAALAAGIGILVMAALAVFANFAVVEHLVTEGDAERTARDIRASDAMFRSGVAALALVAVLDVIVAWALLTFFAPVHKGVSTLAAWFRLAYAAVLMVAASQLAGVPSLAAADGHAGPQGADQRHVEALMKVDAFHDVWDTGLILFGFHLLALGYLAYRSGYVPRILGVLLVIAGLGYLTDSFGALLSADYGAEVAMFAFVGEFVLMVWLLVKGRNVTAEEAPRNP